MQQTIQRRPHSVAISNGNGHATNGDISREQRRAERRQAKLQRDKKGKRRKRKKSPDPTVVAVAAFSVCALIVFSVY